MPETGKRAVVLLSGGLDSATAAALARADGFALSALTVDYGQRHDVEIAAARDVARALGAVRHVVVPVGLRAFGGSALTSDIAVPKGRAEGEMRGIPVTYVPARNTIFLALALAWAEVVEAPDIFFGANVRDYSGYPDCRPEYVRAFEAMANLATKGAVEGTLPVRVHCPLIDKTKADIIALGTGLGVDYGLTRSCYDPDAEGRACGTCDSCTLRLKGFAEAGLDDPAPYRKPERMR